MTIVALNAANSTNITNGLVISDPVTVFINFIISLGMTGIAFFVISFFIARAILGEESYKRIWWIIYALMGVVTSSYVAYAGVNFTAKEAIAFIFIGFMISIIIYLIKKEENL